MVTNKIRKILKNININDFIGTANGSTSELIYKPQSEREYGALSCRGTNSVGRQLEPCIFQIVPAGKSTLKLTACLLEESSIFK